MIALAEHAAISKAPLARGLKKINTEKASVPMRCVWLKITDVHVKRCAVLIIYRERIYREGGILSVTSRILIVDLLLGLS